MLIAATNIFPNYSSDTLGLIVIKNNEGPLINIDDLVLKCKKDLIRFATFDIIILAIESVLSL